MHASMRCCFVWVTILFGAANSVAWAGFTGVRCELVDNSDWTDNGYDPTSQDTWRIYITFDGLGDDGVLAVFGQPGDAMQFQSGDGLFHNDALGSNTAPLDLTGAGLWTNQWDTYVTINATSSAGDATGLSPGFDVATSNLGGDFTDDNIGWFVTPDDPQSSADSNNEVLIAQFTVSEGSGVVGLFNILTRENVTINGLVAECGSAVCGNGVIEGLEACDDGGTADGDGCSSTCQVESGFSCSSEPSVCVDIDECANMTDNCDDNATCTNTNGSFTCQCNDGFEGDGVTCSLVESICGDSDCNGEEDCVTCPDDCGCDTGLFCSIGSCNQSTGDCDIVSACPSSAECPDAVCDEANQQCSCRADLCADALEIFAGDTPFTTLGATTDGPVHAECQFDGQTYSDIWYHYVATCTGDLTVSTCNQALYDTDLVVYDGSDCDNLVLGACNDDFAGCTGFTSEVILPVVSGNTYLVRVGGFNPGDEGAGTLTITPALCPEGGACCQCRDDGVPDCTIETQADCAALAGEYQGDDTPCDGDEGPACAGQLVCGNGQVECEEECDDVNGNSDTLPDVCRTDCTLPRCGDGVTDSNEECDDGNTIDFDTCSNSCIAQPDGDGDGVADAFDECPDNSARVCDGPCTCDYTGPVSTLPPSHSGFATIAEFCADFGLDYDIDTDGDGVYDCHDHCPLDILKTTPGICGCQWPDVDSDGDGTYDCPCPGTPQPCTPGAGDCLGGTCVECAPAGSPTGFGASCSGGEFVCVIEDTCGDYCPTDADKLIPGVCGCHSIPDADSDGDGVLDCADDCPLDPDKIEPGVCGCSYSDSNDGDDDGTPDCVDACPDDPAKSISPGFCGCGETETPAGGHTVGGFVHVPNGLLDGIPYVEVTLTCQSLDPAYDSLQHTTTCDEATGLFRFDGVPCGPCALAFRYADTCEDVFNVSACGVDATVGADEWVAIDVNPDTTGGVAPCLQSIEVVATNNNYDILMQNAACQAQPGVPCFDHIGRPAPSLSASLIRLAGCFFGNACCGPADSTELGPVTECKCAYDCNNDGIFSIVSDLSCWSQCLIAGACHPGACGDDPSPGGVLPSGFAGLTIGGIVYEGADDPLMSGVEGIRVDVIDTNGLVYSATTNRIGVWVVDGLGDGPYVVEYDGGKGTRVIDVREADEAKNQSLKWRVGTVTRASDRGDRRARP